MAIPFVMSISNNTIIQQEIIELCNNIIIRTQNNNFTEHQQELLMDGMLDLMSHVNLFNVIDNQSISDEPITYELMMRYIFIGWWISSNFGF